MTSITTTEVKIVYFALIFMSVFGAFLYFYNTSDIQVSYAGGIAYNNTTATIPTDPESNWISSILSWAIAPFDDPMTALVGAVIITPIVAMLGYISIRAIKDLISQWV